MVCVKIDGYSTKIVVTGNTSNEGTVNTDGKNTQTPKDVHPIDRAVAIAKQIEAQDVSPWQKLVTAVKDKKDFFNSFGLTSVGGLVTFGSLFSTPTLIASSATGGWIAAKYSSLKETSFLGLVLGGATAALGGIVAAGAVLSTPIVVLSSVVAGSFALVSGFFGTIADEREQSHVVTGSLAGAALSFALAHSAVSTLIEKPTTSSEATNTTTQIETAKGTLKDDFISRATFEPTPSETKENVAGTRVTGAVPKLKQ